jgi:hypothetical protein
LLSYWNSIQGVLHLSSYSSAFSVLSYSNFIVSDFILRSLIHLELILVKGERLGSIFSLLQVDIQFSQYHLLKRSSFLLHTFWTPLSKIKWLYLCGFVSESSILFYWSSCVFLCQHHAVLFLWFCSIVWSQILWYLQHFCYLSEILWLFKVICASTWTLGLIFLREEGHWNFDGDYIEHKVCFW